MAASFILAMGAHILVGRRCAAKSRDQARRAKLISNAAGLSAKNLADDG